MSDKKLSDFKQQARNSNAHTERGISMLETSIQEVGYAAPMIAAADHEIISGSARHQVAADVFGSDAKPIIIESDGTKPIVVVRTDIATADTLKAKRLSLYENRVAELDLSYDSKIIADMAANEAEALSGIFSQNEIEEIAEQTTDEGAGARGFAQPTCWILISIPMARYSEIAATVDGLGAIEGATVTVDTKKP